MNTIFYILVLGLVLTLTGVTYDPNDKDGKKTLFNADRQYKEQIHTMTSLYSNYRLDRHDL